MKVLYIAEDYIYSKVHHLLCNSIVEAASRMDLTIYSVLRSNKKRQFDISGFFEEKKNYYLKYVDRKSFEDVFI